uniref:G_PROTEIN_RECEP_F1_2 domain-containing protein n=1 Tax=Ascaris lumbricoides TaxID=6252 RepID=A0A0M3HGP3_ASCLU
MLLMRIELVGLITRTYVQVENTVEVEICHPTYFSYFWIVFTYMYAILSVFVHSVSLWFTVNMAILRYLVLKRSSISRSSLPNVNSFSAAFVAIVLAILISFLGSAPNMLRYEVNFRIFFFCEPYSKM